MEPVRRTGAFVATTVLGLGTLVSHGFGLSLVPAMLPRIEASFGSGYGVLGLAVATGLIAYGIGGIAASRILDWLPTRTVLNGSFVLTAVGLMVAAVAPSAAVIALPVVLLGVVAPISWAATTHVAAQAVGPGTRSLVMAGASGGAGAGVIVSGVLVQAFSRADAWRAAFVLAAGIALLVTGASMILFRAPIGRPSMAIGGQAGPSAFRNVLAEWPGRVIVLTSAITGVAAFTFVTFLTTTAIEEMGAGAVPAAALLWVVGIVGLVASLVLGRLSDRGSPTLAVTAIVTVYAVSLILLSILWSYPALVVAALGLGMLNYPVWGLVAAIASQRFRPSLAVRAISLGLAGAAGLGAIGNALAGEWIDSTGSMRAVVVILAGLASLLGLWLAMTYRRHVVGSPVSPPAGRI